MNTLTSNLFVPNITLASRITSHSKTLIDNIFSNDPNFAQGISGNFTFSISDHLAQFLIVPKQIDRVPRKHNIWKRDLTKLDQVTLVGDFLDIHWPEILSLDRGDINYSFDMFDKKINEILDKNVPYKKIDKKQLRLEAKPWITQGILTCIKRRDHLLKQYINPRNSTRKNEIHLNYKSLRNKIVALITKSKKNYFKDYLTENAKDIQKTWEWNQKY